MLDYNLSYPLSEQYSKSKGMKSKNIHGQRSDPFFVKQKRSLVVFSHIANFQLVSETKM